MTLKYTYAIVSEIKSISRCITLGKMDITKYNGSNDPNIKYTHHRYTTTIKVNNTDREYKFVVTQNCKTGVMIVRLEYYDKFVRNIEFNLARCFTTTLLHSDILILASMYIHAKRYVYNILDTE